jgi:hypothetical protein
MTQAMTDAPPKRSLTPAQRRLRKADPTLAAIMDAWALEIDQTLDAVHGRLVAAQDDAQAAVAAIRFDDVTRDLAVERARLLKVAGMAMDETLKVAELGVMVARQTAAIAAAERMGSVAPQAALPPPPPPPDDDDDPADTEPLRAIVKEARQVYEAGGKVLDNFQRVWDDDAPTVPLATKVGRWWTRVRRWGRRQVHAAATSAILTLRGWA